jgi:Fe-S-cluster containining protein
VVAGPAASLPVIPYRSENVCLARGCSACCRGTEMLLTEADVERLSAARPGADFHFRAPDGYLQLKTRPEDTDPCVFLTLDGRCSVHDVRPEGCRLYPGVWDEELRRTHLDDEHCPHTDGFNFPRVASDAVVRLARRLRQERDQRIGSRL